MKVLLVTVGSHGDVHPFVGLGLELKRRGHEAILVTNGHFQSLAQSAGLGFVELGTDEQFRQTIADPALWHRTQAFKRVFELAGELIEPAIEIIREHSGTRDTVVAASSLALGARIAQDHLNVPTATVHLAPSVMRTVYDVPKLPGLFLPDWVPKWMKHALWAFGDACIIDPVVGPIVNTQRAKLGLKPVKGILRDWWHSPQRVIGMWPQWFGPAQPDWPGQVRLVGFPLYDETGITPISKDLDAWLSAGTPPIAFTAGSAMVHGAEFFEASAQACAQLNRRGLLLTRHRDQIPANLPPGVRHEAYAPFAALLPRCAALVHHGGIGTTAQALRAGVPQLIMPMAHDQLDNAFRVRQLGVGASIEPKHYRPHAVRRAFLQLLDVPSVMENCRGISRKFEGIDALGAASDLLEELTGAQMRQEAGIRVH